MLSDFHSDAIFSRHAVRLSTAGAFFYLFKIRLESRIVFTLRESRVNGSSRKKQLDGNKLNLIISVHVNSLTTHVSMVPAWEQNSLRNDQVINRHTAESG